MLLLMMLAITASCQREDFEPLQPPVVSINMSCSRGHSQQNLKRISFNLQRTSNTNANKKCKLQNIRYKIQKDKEEELNVWNGSWRR